MNAVAAVRIGFRAAASLASLQVLRDDLRALGRRELLEVDLSGSATADHRLAVCCSDIPDPLRLPGESDEVVIAPVASPKNRHAAHLPGRAPAHLERDGVSRSQTERCQQHTKPVEAPIPSRRGSVGRAGGVVLRLHVDPPDRSRLAASQSFTATSSRTGAKVIVPL